MDSSILAKYLRDLEMLVNIDSSQDSPEGIREVATFFNREFMLMGWKTSMVDVGAVAPCFVAVNREAEHYDIFLTGHMDTVFPKGTAAQRPFSIDGNIAKGPGVCDMKHGLLSASMPSGLLKRRSWTGSTSSSRSSPMRRLVPLIRAIS